MWHILIRLFGQVTKGFIRRSRLIKGSPSLGLQGGPCRAFCASLLCGRQMSAEKHDIFSHAKTMAIRSSNGLPNGNVYRLLRPRRARKPGKKRISTFLTLESEQSVQLDQFWTYRSHGRFIRSLKGLSYTSLNERMVLDQNRQPTALLGPIFKPFDGGRVLKSFQKKRTLMLKL